MYRANGHAAVLAIVFQACAASSSEVPSVEPNPWEETNPFFGTSLHRLTNATAPGNTELRRTARNYLRATTDMTNETIADIEKKIYPEHYHEKPDLWGEEQYDDRLRPLVTERTKVLKRMAGTLLDDVMMAHEDLSDLAKGSGITDLIDAKMRSKIKDQFGDHEDGTKEWRDYLFLMRDNSVISPTQEADWLQIPDGPTRRETVFQFIKGKLEHGTKLPIKVLWDFGLPGWMQVELDFMKTYIKLFNGEGKSGTKYFGNDKSKYSLSLEYNNDKELREEYQDYKNNLNKATGRPLLDESIGLLDDREKRLPTL